MNCALVVESIELDGLQLKSIGATFFVRLSTQTPDAAQNCLLKGERYSNFFLFPPEAEWLPRRATRSATGSTDQTKRFGSFANSTAISICRSRRKSPQRQLFIGQSMTDPSSRQQIPPEQAVTSGILGLGLFQGPGVGLGVGSGEVGPQPPPPSSSSSELPRGGFA